MCRLSWNLGASTSWNPQGLSRPAMGLLYLFTEYSDYLWQQNGRSLKFIPDLCRESGHGPCIISAYIHFRCEICIINKLFGHHIVIEFWLMSSECTRQVLYAIEPGAAPKYWYLNWDIRNCSLLIWIIIIIVTVNQLFYYQFAGCYLGSWILCFFVHIL